MSLMLVLLSVSVFSQIDQKKVDSLRAALASSTGKNRYDILDKLAYEYVWNVDTIALAFATEAFEMSWQFGDSARIVKSGRTKAMAFNRLQRYDSTIALLNDILPIARRNNCLEEVKRMLNLLALAHTNIAEYDKALIYNFEALDLRRRDNDSLLVSIALNNIGLVYYKLEDLVHAAEYFSQAFELRSINGEPAPNIDNDFYLSSVANLGLCYAYMNDLKKATSYVEKALRYSQEGCSDLTLITVYFSSGMLRFKQGDLMKASAIFLQSLAIARKVNDRRGELDNLIWLSEISVKSNQLAKAERYLLQAEPLFDTDTPFRAELAEVYAQLGKIYTKLGNYHKAAVYQSKHIDLSAKVYTRHLTINLMKVQSEYNERENKSKIEAQAKILDLNNDIIARQRAFNIVIGIVAFLLIALVISLFQNVKQKRMANQLLEQKVKQRTVDLEFKHDLLIKVMQERDHEVQRMTNEIKASLSTIKGLGLLVLHDVNLNSATTYVNKIEQTSNNLLEGLNLGRTNSSD